MRYGQKKKQVRTVATTIDLTQIIQEENVSE
jgi:hypothetical protein